MRSHVALPKSHLAALVAAAALIGGVVASGALTLAGAGTQQAPNTAVLCIDADDHSLYSPNRVCAASDSELAVKTPLTGRPARALHHDVNAARAMAAKLARRLDAMKVPKVGEGGRLEQQEMQTYLYEFYKAIQLASTLAKSENRNSKTIIDHIE